MPTECIAEHFDFGTIEGRAVEPAFDAGLVTSDAGGFAFARDGSGDRTDGSVCDVPFTKSRDGN